MRLLHVHSGNLFGGVETMMLAMVACDTPKMRSEFALCFDGRLAEGLRRSRAKVRVLGEVRVRRPLSIYRARRNLRSLLREERFDFAACHMPWAQALFGPVFRECRIPLIFWMHGLAGGRHWLERWARRAAPDQIICASRSAAASVPLLYPRAAVAVIHPPVHLAPVALDAAGRRAVREQLRTSPEAVVILQASRMESLKGHQTLIDALARLTHSADWVAWIAGAAQSPSEARYFAKLQKQAERLGIADRVRFLGARSDVPRLMAAADIYCQPNLRPEAFGISFIEALAQGIPVVSTDFGGAAEIIDASCGRLVTPVDAGALVDALAKLIKDRALREALGAAGPLRARTLCEPQKQMEKLCDALDGMTRRREFVESPSAKIASSAR